MSGHWKLTALVLERSQAERATLLVALAIAHRASRRDADWTSGVSVRSLAILSTCDKGTVRRAITELESLGELEVHRPGGTGPNEARQNRYRIRAENLSKLPTRLSRRGCAVHPPGGGAAYPQGGRVTQLPGGVIAPPPTTDSAVPATTGIHPPSVGNSPTGGVIDVFKNGAQRVTESLQSDYSVVGSPGLAIDHHQLLEDARTALAGLVDRRDMLRSVLEACGWCDDEGHVLAWINRQPRGKLVEIVERALAAQEELR